MENTLNINEFLTKAVKEGASDVHLRIDEAPAIRKNGKIIRTTLPPVTEKDLSHVLNTVLPKYLKTKVQSSFDLDFSYEIKGVSRFRINLARQLGHTALVFRIIPYETPSIEELLLPPTIKGFAGFSNGIILVTGPTGSGKTTTIAALIDLINQNEQKHIIQFFGNGFDFFLFCCCNCNFFKNTIDIFLGNSVPIHPVSNFGCIFSINRNRTRLGTD